MLACSDSTSIYFRPCAQRNAAQATAGMPTASRLNAGLLGFSLFSLALLPFHKDALSKLGLGCGSAHGSRSACQYSPFRPLGSGCCLRDFAPVAAILALSVFSHTRNKLGHMRCQYCFDAAHQTLKEAFDEHAISSATSL